MQDQPSEASGERVPPTEAQDIRDQGVVLIHVLHAASDVADDPRSRPRDHRWIGGLRRGRRDGARCARSDGRGAAHVPERPRRAHSGRPALPGDPLRRQLLGGAGDFGGSGCSREARIVGSCSRPAGIPSPRMPSAKGTAMRSRSREIQGQFPMSSVATARTRFPIRSASRQGRSRTRRVPAAATLTPHHSALRRPAPRTPRHTMNSVRGCLRTPGLDECSGALGRLSGLTTRWHRHASSSTRRPSRRLPAAWSRSSNGAGSKGGSLSMRLSLLVASGSSALGSTRTRSSLGRSSWATDRSHGCGSIRRSPLGCCGGLAMDRRLTRPPARVSGRASLRAAEGAGCGCFRSTGGGRTTRPLRLR